MAIMTKMSRIGVCDYYMLVTMVKLLIPFILLFELLVFFFTLNSYVIFLHIRSEKLSKIEDNVYGNPKMPESRETEYQYKYFVVDSISQNAKRGIVTLKEPLFEGEEFDSFSYESSNGRYAMISSFGVEEYICTGSCFCEELEKERRSFPKITSVRKGLIYLVSGVSSLVAIQKAEEYYNEECVKGLQNECLLESIRSEVDECESIFEMSSSHGDQVEKTITAKTFIVDEEGNTEIISLEPDHTEFLCSGRCARNTDSSEQSFEEFGNKRAYSQIFREIFGVPKRVGDDPNEREKQIFASYVTGVTTGRMNNDVFCHSLELKNVKVSVDRLEEEQSAIDLFVSSHLRNFCHSNSVFTDQQYKDRFVETFMGNELGERLYDKTVEIRSKSQDLDKNNVCTAEKVVHLISPARKVNNIVCLRIFTDEEWKKGIPYESENLRHWKEGYKMKPDEISDDDFMASHQEKSHAEFDKLFGMLPDIRYEFEEASDWG